MISMSMLLSTLSPPGMRASVKPTPPARAHRRYTPAAPSHARKPPEHLVDRLRPGASARLAPRRGTPSLARPPDRGGDGVHQPLDAFVALLALEGDDDDRASRPPARRDRQRHLSSPHRARSGDGDDRVDGARRRLPVVLHRQVAPLLRIKAAD